MNEYDVLERYIRESNYVVALTGAGISTAAGIPDFRGEKGIYTLGIVPERVFDIDYFLRDPRPFYEFTRRMIETLEGSGPTLMHRFLAYLEEIGKLKLLVTQNIDGLHTLAGSKNVIEIHGSYRRSFCLNCGKEYDFSEVKEMILKNTVPYCSCGGLIKPDVVFFGEGVKGFEEARQHAYLSDLFLVVGSSLQVQPASLLPYFSPGKVVIINKGPVAFPRSRIDVHIDEDCELVAEELMRRLKK